MLQDMINHGGPAGIRRAGDRSARARSARARPSTRLGRRLFGTAKARLSFLDLLARHGDPAVAADQLGLSLVQMFRLRDADSAFAADWHAAMGYAWERVENRLLAELLQVADGNGAATRLLDTKLAHAILNRREQPVMRAHGPPVESASVARVRAELRDLAGVAG